MRVKSITATVLSCLREPLERDREKSCGETQSSAFYMQCLYGYVSLLAQIRGASASVGRDSQFCTAHHTLVITLCLKEKKFLFDSKIDTQRFL